VKVDLHENTNNLPLRSFVVANQDQLKKEIEAGYMVERKEEKFDCTVYYIIAKKTLISKL
jgi:hypothetical protein